MSGMRLLPRLETESFDVQCVGRTTALEKRGDIRCSHHCHLSTSLDARTGKMRSENHVFSRDEPRMNVRLAFVDVQSGSRYQAAFQCVNKRVFVDYRTPRCVDQIGGSLHLFEFGGRN